MRGAGVRVEALRFTLLIVLTIALASVAFRINSHSSSTSSQARPRVPPATSHPPSSTPSGVPSAATTSPAPHHPRTTGGGGNGSGSGAGPAASAGAGTPAQLPVTGWDPAMKLGAFAFVLIGGGMLTIRSAGPSRRQRASVQD